MSTPGSELIESRDSHALVPQVAAPTCANCGEPVSDRFCGHCGQRLEHRVHSLSEFMGEAAEVITHADSRVWRTFVPLLFRPGFLTQQYLAGRRASYLPPFRLYIVLSVVFFLMVSLAIRTTHVSVVTPAKAHVTAADTLAELQKEIDASDDPQEQAILRQQLERFKKVNAELTNLTSNGSCETRIAAGSLPDWLRTRMVTGCQKIAADNGRELLQNVIHNIGRAMFVFLPLIAALMKLLYWRPRRFYVEHLLLLLHNHAFFFVSASMLLALQMIIPSAGVMGWLIASMHCGRLVRPDFNLPAFKGDGLSRAMATAC
jgi:hypothetical protein